MTYLPSSIVDSHQHFWQLNRGDYTWLTPQLAPIYRDFLPANYLDSANPCNIRKTVLVQAAATNDETDFMLQLSEQHDFISGVVGWLDMEAPTSVLCARLEQLGTHSTFKGIRPMLQDIQDVDWILNPAFKPIFDKLIELNLCFDALVFTQHLDNILLLADRYPNLKIVIDHCAKPDIATGKFELWARKLRAFKDKTNVLIKVSGLTTEAKQGQDQPSDFQPYFDLVYQTFSASRMMWGSDWPVVNLSSTFEQWYQLSQALIEGWQKHEVDDFFANTACRFYNLNQI